MRYKNVVAGFAVAMMSVMMIAGCGKENETGAGRDVSAEVEQVQDTVDESTEMEQVVGEEAPEGYYFSELTHELTDINLKNQRPVAIMVDNEKIALPHYGLTQADVVYEMVNSTANGRITRLMCLVKDWEKLDQFGSIRSTRPTNVIFASEWNAILCHDGGPFYIDEYLAQPFAYNLNGGFSRVSNGKPREYTEYICKGDLESRIEKSSFGKEYDGYYNGDHFKFASEASPVELKDGVTAEKIELPFPHNSSQLEYNDKDGLYYYSEYGKAHIDPENDNAQLCFKNVIIQSANMNQLDEHGYMVYDVVGSGDGYYITNGKAEPITWKKSCIEDLTVYYDKNGDEITVNTGKTYIAIVPSDSWSDLVIE